MKNKILLSLIAIMSLGSVVLNAGGTNKALYAYSGQSDYLSFSWPVPAAANATWEVVGYEGGRATVYASGAGLFISAGAGWGDPVNSYGTATTTYAGVVSGSMSVQASGGPSAFGHSLFGIFW